MLTEDDKKRIEAEERYRAEVRARLTTDSPASDSAIGIPTQEAGLSHGDGDFFATRPYTKEHLEQKSLEWKIVPEILSEIWDRDPTWRPMGDDEKQAIARTFEQPPASGFHFRCRNCGERLLLSDHYYCVHSEYQTLGSTSSVEIWHQNPCKKCNEPEPVPIWIRVGRVVLKVVGFIFLIVFVLYMATKCS